jgi:hypothetical protein
MESQSRHRYTRPIVRLFLNYLATNNGGVDLTRNVVSKPTDLPLNRAFDVQAICDIGEWRENAADSTQCL